MGIARRAVDDLSELAATKRAAMASKTLAANPLIQTQLAEADGKRRAARAFVDAAVADVWRSAEQGEVADASRAGLRLAATTATRLNSEVVNACYEAGGGAAIFETSNLQRLFRDMHVVTHHGMVAPRSYETIGRLMLDQPVKLFGF